VYPIHRSAPDAFTVVCVSNTNTDPITEWHTGGMTNVKFDYVNMIPNPADSQLPNDCYVVDRVESLTPADTLCVLTACHNAANAEGYLVVTAQDPLSGLKTPWAFDYLVGSELVVTALGAKYAINAIPFRSPREIGCPTDQLKGDYDGQLDFDDVEYEAIPEKLYLDTFLAAGKSSLTLINMSGGTQFTAVAQFDVWNDNEFPLSATKLFRCWFEEPLSDVSLVFSEGFLSANTPHDPQELDIDCDGLGELETGWAPSMAWSRTRPRSRSPTPPCWERSPPARRRAWMAPTSSGRVSNASRTATS